VSRYRGVDTQKAAGCSAVAACQAAGVTRSAFYAWAAKGEQDRGRPSMAKLPWSPRSARSTASPAGPTGRLGCMPSFAGGLEGEPQAGGAPDGRPRDRRPSSPPPAWPDQGADTRMPPAPDLLGRLFDPDQPDVAWCGDVTYLPTDEGWLYLASVLELASRYLLGWSMGELRNARLVTAALDTAVPTRGRQRMDATIFHTDRGSEYTSAACIDACQRLGLRRSMGRTGSCLDNAVAESFFATLKVELVDRHHYRTRAEARVSIFAWIAWYNRRRLHSTNDYLPPIEWEQQHQINHPLPSPLAA
jgi:putative transposase